LPLAAGLIALALLQAAPCTDAAAQRLGDAARPGEWFDLAAAAAAYEAAAGAGCGAAELAAVYVRNLARARDAYKQGGSPESLREVRAAIAALEQMEGPGLPAVARAVLQAAAASAQSERDEMALMLDHALRLEAVQLEAGQPPLPAVTAHEAAGDLWLQVHGYDQARRAYLRAAERLGPRPRITLGLARAAARTKDVVAACTHYRELVARWGGRPEEPAEGAEARAYSSEPPCVRAPAVRQAPAADGGAGGR